MNKIVIVKKEKGKKKHPDTPITTKVQESQTMKVSSPSKPHDHVLKFPAPKSESRKERRIKVRSRKMATSSLPPHSGKNDP
jgi:hypothetical protein